MKQIQKFMTGDLIGNAIDPKPRRGEPGLTGGFNRESLNAILMNQEAENILDFVMVNVRFG